MPHSNRVEPVPSFEIQAAGIVMGRERRRQSAAHGQVQLSG